MITDVAQNIADYLRKKNIIEQNKLDIYTYGFELMISNFISVLVALIIGMISSELIAVSIFMITFIMLRKFSGGYHADTYLKCNAFFALNVIIMIFLIKTIDSNNIWLHTAVCLIGLATIFILSPIENINKPLNNIKRKKYKKFSLGILLFITSISYILYIYKINYYLVLDISIFSVSISMIIEKLRKENV
ncbi:MAG: accessory gene regulator B family protein [Oscillospiraceae bacterium]|jgi:accessory gene regulator B|nr:accessory gene regulator B family protein [Oscillospiraceae bacterium]